MSLGRRRQTGKYEEGTESHDTEGRRRKESAPESSPQCTIVLAHIRKLEKKMVTSLYRFKSIHC